MNDSTTAPTFNVSPNMESDEMVEAKKRLNKKVAKATAVAGGGTCGCCGLGNLSRFFDCFKFSGSNSSNGSYKNYSPADSGAIVEQTPEPIQSAVVPVTNILSPLKKAVIALLLFLAVTIIVGLGLYWGVFWKMISASEEAEQVLEIMDGVKAEEGELSEEAKAELERVRAEKVVKEEQERKRVDTLHIISIIVSLYSVSLIFTIPIIIFAVAFGTQTITPLEVFTAISLFFTLQTVVVFFRLVFMAASNFFLDQHTDTPASDRIKSMLTKIGFIVTQSFVCLLSIVLLPAWIFSAFLYGFDYLVDNFKYNWYTIWTLLK